MNNVVSFILHQQSDLPFECNIEESDRQQCSSHHWSSGYVGVKTANAINKRQKRMFPMAMLSRRGNQDSQNYDCIRANNQQRRR